MIFLQPNFEQLKFDSYSRKEFLEALKVVGEKRYAEHEEYIIDNVLIDSGFTKINALTYKTACNFFNIPWKRDAVKNEEITDCNEIFKNMTFSSYSKKVFLTGLENIATDPGNENDEFVVDTILRENGITCISFDTYRKACEFFNIAWELNEELEDVAIEGVGPYGGAFKDNDDLYRYQEGKGKPWR